MPKVTEAWKKNKPLYKPVHSSNPKKKGMVYVMKNGSKKLIHFGSGGIKNKAGQLTKNDKNSANYWSRKILWSKKN